MRRARCLCDKGPECDGLSDLFFLNGDPRGGYTRLPVMCKNVMFTSSLWMAWLPHILTPEKWKDFDDSLAKRSIAIHHFHPGIIALFASGAGCQLPPTIHKNLTIDFKLDEYESKVLDKHGSFNGEYFVVPNYSIDDAKQDLMRLVSVPRNNREKRDFICSNILSKGSSSTASIKIRPKQSTRLSLSPKGEGACFLQESGENEVRTKPSSSQKLKKRLRNLEVSAKKLLLPRGSKEKQSINPLPQGNEHANDHIPMVNETHLFVAPAMKRNRHLALKKPETENFALRFLIKDEKMKLLNQSKINAHKLARRTLTAQQQRAVRKQSKVLTKSKENKQIWIDLEHHDYQMDQVAMYPSVQRILGYPAEATYPSIQRLIGYPIQESMYSSTQIVIGYPVTDNEITNYTIVSPVSLSRSTNLETSDSDFLPQSPCDVRSMYTLQTTLDGEKGIVGYDAEKPRNIFANKIEDAELSYLKPSQLFNKVDLDRVISNMSKSSSSVQVFESRDSRSSSSIETGYSTEEELLPSVNKVGIIWQSLVRHQSMLPESWWDGERFRAEGPQTRGNCKSVKHRWRYTKHDRFYSNPILDHFIPDRSSPGRLLLHIVVHNESSGDIEDVVIGCYHPFAYDLNAVMQEDCRVLWMAVRKRFELWSMLDSFLDSEHHSPLENNRAVNNGFLRSVYGEGPPLETVTVTERDFVKRLNSEIHLTDSMKPSANPTFVLLEMFLRCQVEV